MKNWFTRVWKFWRFKFVLSKNHGIGGGWHLSTFKDEWVLNTEWIFWELSFHFRKASFFK